MVGAAFRHAGANAVAILHAGEPLSVHKRHNNGGISANGGVVTNAVLLRHTGAIGAALMHAAADAAAFRHADAGWCGDSTRRRG